MSGEAPPPRRLLSLDVFRGATIAGMILVNNPGSWSHIYHQLDHADWNGWTFTDLIFPFFLFITGVSLVLSRSNSAQQSKSKIYLKILRRSAILFALGLFLNGFPYYNLATLRIMGVLQRIAICYFFASIIYLETSLRGQIFWILSLLFSYWGLMVFFPVPELGAGLLEKGRNFAAYVDQIVLGKHVWANTKTWDPEGLVSTLPAIATTLFGILSGTWLRAARSDGDKAGWLIAAGSVGLLAGSLWSEFLPINKNLWTSSYSVFMSGFALVVLGTLYYLIEIRRSIWWTKPFIVFGMNAITLFVLSGIIGRILILWKVPAAGHPLLKTYIYKALFVPRFSPINASLAYAVSMLLFLYLPLWWLHKKKIFIKI